MKLFTTAIDKQLFAQYKYGNDLSKQKVVAKIFNAYGRGTWYLLNSDINDPDYIWAIVDLFDIEIGSVSRSELESIKVPPYNLSLERDTSFTPINAMELFKGLKAGKHYKEGGELEDYKADIQLIEQEKTKKYFLYPNPSEKNNMGIMFKNGGLTGKDSWTVIISYPMKNTRDGWVGYDSIDINVNAHNYDDAKNKALKEFKKLYPNEKGTVTNVSSNEENSFSKMLKNAKYEDGGYMEEGGTTSDEPKVVRGFFEDEEYEYESGGSTHGITFSVELNDDEDQVYEFATRDDAFSFARKKEREGNEVTSVDEYKSIGRGRHEKVNDLLRSFNNYSIRLRMSSGKFSDGGYMAKGGINDITIIDILHYPSKKRALNTEINNEVLNKIDRYLTFVPNTKQEYTIKMKGASRGEYGITKEQGDKIIEIINNSESKKMSDGGYMAKGGTIYGDFKIKIEKDESPYNKDYKGLNVKVDKDGVPLKYVLKALVDYKDKDYLKQALENKTVQIFVKLYTRYVPLGHISKNTYDAFVEMENSKTMSDGGIMAKGGKISKEWVVNFDNEENGSHKTYYVMAKSESEAIDKGFRSISEDGEESDEYQVRSVYVLKYEDGGVMNEVEETEDEPKVVRGFFEDEEYEYAEGGEIESKINALYVKSKFINNHFNWESKLLEMLQDGSIEAYNIYQSLSKKQKDSVLQELFETDNDMGSYGDGEIETSKENLDILLEDAKSGKRYAEGGEIGGLTADESIYLYVKRGVVQLYREKYLKPIGLYNTPKMKDVEKSLIKKGFLNASGAINKLGKDKAKEVDTKIGGMISGGYLTTLELSDKYKKIVEKFESNDSMSDGGYMA